MSCVGVCVNSMLKLEIDRAVKRANIEAAVAAARAQRVRASIHHIYTSTVLYV